MTWARVTPLARASPPQASPAGRPMVGSTSRPRRVEPATGPVRVLTSLAGLRVAVLRLAPVSGASAGTRAQATRDAPGWSRLCHNAAEARPPRNLNVPEGETTETAAGRPRPVTIVRLGGRRHKPARTRRHDLGARCGDRDRLLNDGAMPCMLSGRATAHPPRWMDTLPARSHDPGVQPLISSTRPDAEGAVEACSPGALTSSIRTLGFRTISATRVSSHLWAANARASTRPIVITVSGVAHASRRTPPPRATRTCLDRRRRRRHRRAERVR